MDCKAQVLPLFFKPVKQSRLFDSVVSVIDKAMSKPAGLKSGAPSMTVNVMDGGREKCLKAGMDDRLSKPVRPGDLEHVLKRVNLRQNLPAGGGDATQ